MEVLYIDDQAGADAFESLKEMLGDEGINVTLEATIDGALARVTAPDAKFDVLVVDVIMPPLGHYSLEESKGGLETGFRLVTQLRRMLPKTPIVIVSIKRNEAGEALKRQLDVADYIEKPVSVAHLAKAIKRANATIGGGGGA